MQQDWRKSTYQQVTMKSATSKTKGGHAVFGNWSFVYVYNLKWHHDPRKELLDTNTELHSLLNRCFRINKCPIQSKMPASNFPTINLCKHTPKRRNKLPKYEKIEEHPLQNCSRLKPQYTFISLFHIWTYLQLLRALLPFSKVSIPEPTRTRASFTKNPSLESPSSALREDNDLAVAPLYLSS